MKKLVDFNKKKSDFTAYKQKKLASTLNKLSNAQIKKIESATNSLRKNRMEVNLSQERESNRKDKFKNTVRSASSKLINSQQSKLMSAFDRLFANRHQRSEIESARNRKLNILLNRLGYANSTKIRVALSSLV